MQGVERDRKVRNEREWSERERERKERAKETKEERRGQIHTCLNLALASFSFIRP